MLNRCTAAMPQEEERSKASGCFELFQEDQFQCCRPPKWDVHPCTGPELPSSANGTTIRQRGARSAPPECIDGGHPLCGVGPGGRRTRRPRKCRFHSRITRNRLLSEQPSGRI